MAVKILSIDNIVESKAGKKVSVSFDVTRTTIFFGFKRKHRVTISNAVACPDYATHHLTSELYYHDEEIKLFCLENKIEQITKQDFYMNG